MGFDYVSREEGLRLQGRSGVWAVDVSSFSETHSFLSPYTWDRTISLPVPGLPHAIAHSVEGVWQGLKIIDGNIDERFLRTRPRKRPGHVEGHRLGHRTLGLREAREEIYYPTYFGYLEDYVDAAVFDHFLDRSMGGTEVVFFDVESNGGLTVDEPLAHSAVLATFMNLKLWNRMPLDLRRPPSESPRLDLADQLDEMDPPPEDSD